MQDTTKARKWTALKWTIIICLLIIILYYRARYTNKKKNMSTKMPLPSPTENAQYLINTPGCTIPKYSKSFKHTPLKYLKGDCGHRNIFINKISDKDIQFIIDTKLLKEFERKKMPYSCYYNYALRSTEVGHEDATLKYSEKMPFKNGTISILEHEVITVECNFINSSSKPVYEDSYMIVKKKEKPLNQESMWNVLIIGMDTMSRARVYQTMPKVVKYLRNENWLDFRAYQKVGANTFPNLMAGLGGLTASSAYKQRQNSVEFFDHHIIWNQYLSAGYATAYGEEHLECPDTFSRYAFETPPTEHYMRPLFLLGEHTSGRIMCCGHLPSGAHILNYAADFVDTYKLNNYFGFFWINSYSHHLHQDPALFDEKVHTFFRNLKVNGKLNKTFVIFYSDHGIRFGDKKLMAESFYDERLPMFFMRMPELFMQKYAEEAQNAVTNQYRLVTTYDFYLTMWKILNKSSFESIEKLLDFCPSCSSVFELKAQTKTCAAAGEEAMPWCACCHLEKINSELPIVKLLINIGIRAVINKSLSVKTEKCTECRPLSFHKLLRGHKCYDRGTNITHYVVAFEMNPFALKYEAIITQDNMKVIALDTIGTYNTHSGCSLNNALRAYCVCRTLKHCRDAIKKHDHYHHPP